MFTIGLRLFPRLNPASAMAEVVWVILSLLGFYPLAALFPQSHQLCWLGDLPESSLVPSRKAKVL